jgi:hypothetical protein
MKTAALLPLTILALAPVAGCAAANHDFDNVVSPPSNSATPSTRNAFP